MTPTSILPAPGTWKSRRGEDSCQKVDGRLIPLSFPFQWVAELPTHSPDPLPSETVKEMALAAF